MTKCMLLQLVQLVASTAALGKDLFRLQSKQTLPEQLLIHITATTPTAAASMHPQLELSRPGCYNCELEDGERVSFVCEMNSCTPGSFSIGFYRMYHSKPVSIHANTPILPGGPVVNVTGLESDTEACAKVLTFVASESLNHAVLVCIAVGYSHPICSLPIVLTVRGMYSYLIEHRQENLY